MGRPVILSNTNMMVGLNEHGLVHDFYYPYIGLDNLTTARSVHHKIGVWVDGTFSWVDDGSWSILIDFDSEALISNITMRHPSLGIELHLQDFVDHKFNAFCRKITVTNLHQSERSIRLFLHQVFQISRAGRGDTALYEPDEHYILDYKGRSSLLIYGHHDGTPCDQFAIGSYAIEGKEGTFRDAEDGELSGNPIEHGGVDSVMRFAVQLADQQSADIDYWIVVSDSQFHAERVHQRLKREGLAERLNATKAFWQEWLGKSADILKDVPEEYQHAVKKSLLIIKAHTDKHGGVVASGDSSIYNYGRDYYSYVWPRDGAYAMWPLIRLGYTEEAQQFFEFCRDTLSPDGYLMHKYQPDRAIGSTWHPLLHGNRKELAIQEDETAIVLYMLGEYYRHTDDAEFVTKLYPTFVQPTANFLTEFIDEATGLPHASYDLWEEKFLTSTYTTAVVYQALLVASQLAEVTREHDDSIKWKKAAEGLLAHADKFVSPETGAYHKGFLVEDDNTITDATLDTSSMYGVMMYGLHDHDARALKATVSQVEAILLNKSPSNGLPRYEHDRYFESQPPYMGNPWLVTTLWLAQYYIRTNAPDHGREYIDWTLRHAYPSGVLPEQINPSNGAPVSVAPLVWSHAELINTILDLSAQDESDDHNEYLE